MFLTCIISKKEENQMVLLPWLPNWGALCGINEEIREEIAKVRGRKEKT